MPHDRNRFRAEDLLPVSLHVEDPGGNRRQPQLPAGAQPPLPGDESAALLHPHQDDRRHHLPVPDGGLKGLERFVFYVNFAPDLGVDHDLAERNIQILRADGVSAAVSSGLFVLLDRGEFRGQEFTEFTLIGIDVPGFPGFPQLTAKERRLAMLLRKYAGST
jgi:hypothetical protein